MFKLKSNVKSFEGNDKVEAVVLENGEKIKTDFVLLGIGVKPSTEFINGIEKTSDGGIKVDKSFWAAADIYAAGDIAVFPYWLNDEDVRIEHWRSALQQGRVAGFAMAGKNIEYDSIPFFWTKQAGLNVRYVGHAAKWDDIIYWGEVSSKKFIAFYIKNNRAVAAAGNDMDKEMAAIHMLMRLDKMPSPKELKNGKVDLTLFLQK